ncbi:hypothetical protein AKJ52_01170 [candidate division MSBL1 archaeon SCGC-AAA382C18]|uniref:Glycosyltransferase 2-like domain-containing protein n=1 Tax=candidate division MSBL1 archaeon SCGC-AAA382C18 TaxID=1698281 RepID=A0A133VKN6_9EURY|nr:hypothetical protein AKJ52_01170 [candidate division MSBL1 archaeon SCGC-AAA382C18]
MFVSIVIPTYNRRNLLKLCLRSLVQQSYPEKRYEILVIDDGSTDGTLKLLRKLEKKIPNLFFYRGKGNGPGSARNIGIRKSEGEIVFFTDDDCELPKNWIERFVDFYREHPGVGGVGGYLEADDKIIKSNIFAEYESYMSRLNYGLGETQEYIGGFETPAGGTGNMSYKREVLKEVGGFDESFPVASGEDADLKMRIILNGHNIAYLPVKAIHHREYSLKDFICQNFARSVGEVFFKKKWEKTLRANKDKFGLEMKKGFLYRLIMDFRFEMILLFFLESLIKRFGKLRCRSEL